MNACNSKKDHQNNKPVEKFGQSKIPSNKPTSKERDENESCFKGIFDVVIPLCSNKYII